MRWINKKQLLPWCNLVAMFLMMTTAVGFGINGMTLFYDPVVTDLSENGFTHTAFSLYYSIANLAAILTFPFFGIYYTKKMHRMKRMILIISVITFLTYIGYSISFRLWHFYLFSALRGIVSSGLATIPVTAVLNRWFVEKRNTAISIALMGSNLGTVFYTKLSEFCITAYGWRVAYFIAGGIEFITLCVVLLLFSPSPNLCGGRPYGKMVEKEEQKEEVSARRAMHSSVFWVAGIAFFLGAVALMGVQQCFTTALQREQGFSLSDAGNAMGIHMLAICVGKSVMGMLYDRFDHRVGLLYSSILAVIGILLLLGNGAELSRIYLFALCFGLGNMSSSITSVTLTSDLFGFSEYAAIYGVYNMFIYGGISLAPIAVSAVYERMGSYRPAWYLLAMLMVVSCMLLFAALTKKTEKRSVEKR